MTHGAPSPEPPLLPNEPRVLDAPRQRRLTDALLRPAEGEIGALMGAIRARLDPDLAAARQTKWGKPYPLGQCLEITRAVRRDLARLDPATLSAAAARGHAALTAFLNNGGQMHQVWGDLRGAYFQNAFLAGALYIDVANDTVDPAKPPVDIQTLEASGLTPIRDFQHYARIARRYWGAVLHPNHLLPELAPFYPLIAVIPGGGVRLEADSGYMVMLAHRERFRSSAEMLREPAMDPALFARLEAALRLDVAALADSPEHGRIRALAACAAEAQTGAALSDARRAALGAAVSRVNRHWAA
jgi:hypothetical protein